MWKGKGPSPRVRCIQNNEDCEAKVGRGEWQTKIVLLIPEMKWHPNQMFADEVQIRSKTNREGPSSIRNVTRALL